jgi:hypothetical protein
MKIGEKTIEEVKGQIEHLTREHLSAIDAAFKKFGDETFVISYKSKFDVVDGRTKVTTEINFKPEPNVKDDVLGFVDELQYDLEFEED